MKIDGRTIVRLLREGILENERREQAVKPPRASDDFYARDFGGCPLAIYRRRRGEPEVEPDNEARVVRLADLAGRGSCIERHITDSLRNRLKSAHQVSARKTDTYGDTTFTVSGRADLIVEGDEGSKPVGAERPTKFGIEIKSIGTAAYDEVSSFDKALELRESHVAQADCYNWLFDLRDCFLLYVDRDDSRFRALRVGRDDKRISLGLARLANIEKAIQTEEEPLPEPSFLCYSCPYQPPCPAFQAEV